MLAVKERLNIQVNENVLLDYLKNFDISRDLFDKNVVKNGNDIVIMRSYYDSKRERANTLVMEDEFVGITYKNLDTINNILDENKLVIVK